MSAMCSGDNVAEGTRRAGPWRRRARPSGRVRRPEVHAAPRPVRSDSIRNRRCVYGRGVVIVARTYTYGAPAEDAVLFGGCRAQDVDAWDPVFRAQGEGKVYVEAGDSDPSPPNSSLTRATVRRFSLAGANPVQHPMPNRRARAQALIDNRQTNLRMEVHAVHLSPLATTDKKLSMAQLWAEATALRSRLAWDIFAPPLAYPSESCDRIQ